MQCALRLRETSDIEDFVAEAVAPAIQTPTVHRRLQTSRDQVAARFIFRTCFRKLLASAFLVGEVLSHDALPLPLAP